VRLVTNASPLIFLAKVELLPMLRSCFRQVLDPSAVVAETRLDLPDFIERPNLSEIGHAFVRGAIGTLGLFVLAERLGHLDASTATRKIDDLVDIHGLYLSPQIRRRIRGRLGGSSHDPIKR
jgi:predicted nucleic acid-binding protein